MDTRFRIGYRGWETWTRPKDLRAALRILRRRARRAGASTLALKRRGSDRWGRPRTLDEGLARLREILPRAPVGEVWWVRLDYGPQVLTVRVVAPTARVAETAGNSRIDRIYGEVTARWQVESWGICNRRYIDGTTTWSQHCPWPAPDPGSNAWDIHASRRRMRKIADELARNAEAWGVGRVIYDGRVWDRTRGWHVSPGIGHQDHIHVEGYPERSGTPRGSCP